MVGWTGSWSDRQLFALPAVLSIARDKRREEDIHVVVRAFDREEEGMKNGECVINEQLLTQYKSFEIPVVFSILTMIPKKKRSMKEQ